MTSLETALFSGLVGGLDSKNPAHLVSPRHSPDLLNVLFHNNAIEKRGGYVPVTNTHPKMNSVYNKGHHGRGRASTHGAATDVDSLIVPGCMYAGHRTSYDGMGAGDYGGEFMFRIADLTSLHVGNGRPTGDASGFGNDSGFTVKVRPILSKGPIKKTRHGTVANWKTSNYTSSVGDPGYGMPFCVYLFNNGTGTSPSWQFRFSVHVRHLGTGNYGIVTVTSSLLPRVGQRYHIVFSVSSSSGNVKLRIGLISNDYTVPTYTTDTGTMGSGNVAVGWTPTAIQVFDCPQEFIEESGASTAVPPGLGLDGATVGGYFFASKRAEGWFEDLVIYGQDPLASSNTALDRIRKFDLDNSSFRVLGCWTMDRPGTNYVQEVTGAGNHLYFVPSGPIFDGTSGGPRPTGSWWFNGVTSYAIPELYFPTASDYPLGNPNWRFMKDSTSGNNTGVLHYLLRNNLAHGLEVTFWADSMEGDFEQVLVEITGCMKISVGTDGLVKAYVASADGASYQAVTSSTRPVTPGTRYSITVMRTNTGADVTIYINGVQDVQATGKSASTTATMRVIGSMTIGMGAAQFLNMSASPPAPDVNTANLDTVNVDSRTGFMGRIESLRIIAGSNSRIEVQKDEARSDSVYPQPLLFQSPASTLAPTTLYGEDLSGNDTLANISTGHVIGSFDKHTFAGQKIAYPLTSTTGPTSYSVNRLLPYQQGGHLNNDASPSGPEHLYGCKHETLYVLARWVLNVDDRWNLYGGHYLSYTEGRDSGSSTLVLDGYRHVHVQTSAVTDDMGFFSNLQKRCIESDWMHETWSTYINAGYTHRIRPYSFRSPRELSPQWAGGLSLPMTGKSPVSMVSDWTHQQSGERFLMAGCGRQIYWIRFPWRKDSPFSTELATKTLWGFGVIGDYLYVPGSGLASKQEIQASNTLVFRGWLKPQRLDGKRVIWLKGDLSLSPVRVNLCIYTQDGSIGVIGTGDSNARTWHYVQAKSEASPGPYTKVLRESSLKANAWNHLYVKVSKAGGVSVWVNGQRLNMLDLSTLSTPQSNSLASIGTMDTGSYPGYLLGLPERYSGDGSVDFVVAAVGTTQLYMDPWHGLATDVLIGTDTDSNLETYGIVPKVRNSVASGTGYLLALTEGAGWLATDSSAQANHASLNFNEWFQIGSNLEESSGFNYRCASFRDRLFLTNGQSDPLEVKFTRFSDPDGPFRCWRIGMDAPMVYNIRFNKYEGVVSAANGYYITGTYTFWMSFVDEDGNESEPELLYTFEVPSPDTGLYDIVYLQNLPRSPDPRTVARKFYVSPRGGGDPVHWGDLPDNETWDFMFYGAPQGTEAIETGLKLPAPRARLIAVGGGAVFFGYLTDEPSGQNVFAWSDLRNSNYMPAGNTVNIDSEDGKPLIGMRMHQGRLYISKRDSIWSFSMQGTGLATEASAYLEPVNTSIGVGGGMTVYDNVIYGGGDRGTYYFDGANVAHVSEALIREWQALDHTDDGLLTMYGAFHHRLGQFHLSTRAIGSQWNSLVYVLHTGVGDKQVWSKLRVPEHSIMGQFTESGSDDIELIIGTTSGQLLTYSEDVFLDGHNGANNPSGSVTLSGTSTSATTTTLTLSGANFDTTGPGLRGCEVSIVFNGTTYTRKIESNSATVLTWASPIAGLTGTLAFTICGYEAYWTSPWLAPQPYGAFLNAKFIGLDYSPQASLLTVSNAIVIGALASNRAFPTTGLETRTQDMTTGYQVQPLPVSSQNNGRYFRLKVGTTGIRTPFSLTGWALKFAPISGGVFGQPR